MADLKLEPNVSGPWDFSGVDFEEQTHPSTHTDTLPDTPTTKRSNDWLGPDINPPATGFPRANDNHMGMTHQPGLNQQPYTSSDSISDKNFTKTQNDFNSKYGDIVGKGNIDIESNLKETQNMNFKDWSDALTDSKKWDFKHNSALSSELKKAGVEVDPEEFGNFHFGMVAAARGYSLGQSLFGAGAFQTMVQDGGALADLMASIPSAFSNDLIAREYTMNGGTWGDVSYTANGTKTTDSLNILQGYDFYHAHFADKVPPMGPERPRLDVLEKFESYLPQAPIGPPRTYFDKLLDEFMGTKPQATLIGPELNRPYGPNVATVIPAIGAPLDPGKPMDAPVGPSVEPSMMEQTWNGITSVAKTGWSAVKDFATSTWRDFKSISLDLWNSIGKDNNGNPLERSGFESDYNKRRAEEFGIDWNNDPNRQGKLDAAYRDEWGSMIDSVSNSISDFAKDPVGSIKDAMSSISDTAGNIGDAIADTAKGAWDGFKDALGFGDEEPAPSEKHEPGENNGGRDPNGGQVSGADKGVGNNDVPDSF